MPLEQDSYDVSILKAILKDGRKSFREISRETGITTPTVKSRFDRLVILGDPQVFRFANYERFFCCTGCMSGYKNKYPGRIESIKRKFEGRE